MPRVVFRVIDKAWAEAGSLSSTSNDKTIKNPSSASLISSATTSKGTSMEVVPDSAENSTLFVPLRKSNLPFSMSNDRKECKQS